MRVLIRGGLVVGRQAAIADVLIADGRVHEVGATLSARGAAVIDAEGCWVGPAFVDMHAHLREPGNEDAETIESGARAGAVGGYGALVAMPNTDPALDSVAAVRFVLEVGRRAPIDVAAAASITVGRRGQDLTAMAELAEIGVRIFTDDGTAVRDPAVLRRALTYARPLGVRIAEHAEDPDLVGDGVMNEGIWSGRLGLTGRPAVAELVTVLRDIELARETGGSLHILHVSSAGALAAIVRARREGVDVTTEVTPHHLTLDESACASYDANVKVNPPLRTAADVSALQRALRDGEIDAVATDHAPHAPETKDQAFDEAPAGVLGLEHAAALTLEALGGPSSDPQRFFDLLSRHPAALAGLRGPRCPQGLGQHGGWVEPGDEAHLVVFDPRRQWVVDRATLQSRARNTPYHGRQMTGRAVATIVGGRVVARDGAMA